ncbi:polyphosphate polymerase domain-containing protein [Conyzicola sp.]|uniref:polyphosphate polymerase domain-containing protein n=1 Tax=Conyzicola sp. TaxID=1969404 RepID=UPI00398A0F53
MNHLDTISLDELIAAAALQTRVDRKYILRAHEADAVLEKLDATTRVLEIDGQRASNYESVYFDTPGLLSYRMAATGRRRRFKLRTRSYVDTAESYLEMKTRGARGTTIKDRLPYLMRDRDALTPDGREYADAALDGIGIDHPEQLDLVPTLVTRYRRATLYVPNSQSRATVDTDLSWETNDGAVLRLPRSVIIETKSGQRTSDVDRLLWSHGHRPATISKFGTGLAAMRHDLPSNKWARVLRHHFDA